MKIERRDPDPLRAALRRGDPGHGAQLGDDEARVLRARMLAEVPPATAPTLWPRSAALAAGLALAAAGLAWWWGAGDDGPPAPRVAARAPATSGAPAAAEAPPGPRAATVPGGPETGAVTPHGETLAGTEAPTAPPATPQVSGPPRLSPATEPRLAQAAPTPPVAGGPEAEKQPERPSRKLEMVAPGGTRIVWVLDPRFSLGDRGGP